MNQLINYMYIFVLCSYHLSMLFNLCCHPLSSTVLICSAFFNVLQHVSTRFDMIWSCLITFDHVWSCLIMFAVLVVYNFSCQVAVLTCLQSYRSFFPRSSNPRAVGCVGENASPVHNKMSCSIWGHDDQPSGFGEENSPYW